MRYLWAALRAIFTTAIVLLFVFVVATGFVLWNQGERAGAVLVFVCALVHAGWALHISEDS